jgi:bla regulator protein blaR1
MRFGRIARVIAVVGVGSIINAQQKAKDPQFEVATIKPAVPSEFRAHSGGPGTATPEYYTRTNYPLSEYVKGAYRYEAYSIPNWMSRVRFDIAAKVPPGSTREQFSRMQQILLEERFKLKYHLERVEQPIYRLVMDKAGHKLRTATEGKRVAVARIEGKAPPLVLDKDGFPIFPERPGMRVVVRNGVARVRGYGQLTEEIAVVLSSQVGRRVVDGTGLKGRYDFTLEFSTSASVALPPHVRANDATVPDNVPGVTVFGAIQHQLGLRLEPAKQMVDLFVVDFADRTPGQN